MEARLSIVEQAIVRIDKNIERIDSVIPTLATKLDIADVKTEIQKGINSTERWMIATVIGLFIGFGGLFMAMSNALKPGAPQAQQAPIIINAPGPAPQQPTPVK